MDELMRHHGNLGCPLVQSEHHQLTFLQSSASKLEVGLLPHQHTHTYIWYLPWTRVKIYSLCTNGSWPTGGPPHRDPDSVAKSTMVSEEEAFEFGAEFGNFRGNWGSPPWDGRKQQENKIPRVKCALSGCISKKRWLVMAVGFLQGFPWVLDGSDLSPNLNMA